MRSHLGLLLGLLLSRQKSYQNSAICNQAVAGLLVVLACTALGSAALAQDDAPAAPPPSWQLGLRSTGYFYQTEDAGGATADRTLSYQTFSGSATNLAGGKLLFRGSGRFVNGLAYDETDVEKSRLYTGHLEARLNPGLKARLGRQFIQSGVTGLTLDGAWLNWRRSAGLEASLWGGARTPFSQGFELGDTGQDAAVGGRVALRPNRKWRVAFSGAYRERHGQVAERPVGVEVHSRAVKGAQVLGRAAYDLEQERWARVQLQAVWRKSHAAPTLTLQFLDRHPSIDAASWFSRFADLERIQVARAAVRHVLPSNFGGELEYMGSFVGERNSARVGLAALFPLGRIGYSVRMGDSGEENCFYGEVGHRLAPWLEADAQAAVLTYALMQDAPADQERDLVTLAARIKATLRPGCRLIAQVQSLDNPDYNKDVRFLLGLDLSMARGASEFGLGPGGWLQ
jgi:hypothetical protein